MLLKDTWKIYAALIKAWQILWEKYFYYYFRQMEKEKEQKDDTVYS